MIPAAGVPFVKGHGTENDFVVIPDLSGTLDLSPSVVAAICDRRAGLGGDGLLRVVPTSRCPEVAGLAGEADWFMDYRNADGSVAEMCGNGVRVYARYLLDAGLIAPGRLRLATRGGIREVFLEAGNALITVDMGMATRRDDGVRVSVAGESYPAAAVDLGNPHAVVLLDRPVATLDLSVPPVVPAAVFPSGANVEVVNVLATDRLRMRVVERGVGETRSCGTGACAAAVVAGCGDDWAVEVPGGQLVVCRSGERILLRGPAELVGEGVLRADWLSSRGVSAAP